MLEARDTPSLQVSGTPTFKKQRTILPHPGGMLAALSSPNSKRKGSNLDVMASRYDTSLGVLTRRFAEMVNRSPNRVMDLNDIAQQLGVRKRRVYDVTNVLEGIKLVKKTSKNHIEWIGGYVSGDNQELDTLLEEEEKLDDLIQSYMSQIHQMCGSKLSQEFAYLTYDDIKRIPSFKEQTVIVIRAPAKTKLEVPHPDESLQVHLRSTEGPIEVLVCSDNPDNMKTTHSCVANGSHSNPVCRNRSAPSLKYAKPAPRINTSTPLAKPLRHILPAPVAPAWSQCPYGDQQGLVTLPRPLTFSLGGQDNLLSLAGDGGVTDLFSSVDLLPLHLDVPQ